MSSVTIALMVMQFCHKINTDQVFGTHNGLRREVESLMRHFMKDYDEVVKTRARALPYMLEAHRRMWQPDVGMNRFISRTR